MAVHTDARCLLLFSRDKRDEPFLELFVLHDGRLHCRRRLQPSFVPPLVQFALLPSLLLFNKTTSGLTGRSLLHQKCLFQGPADPSSSAETEISPHVPLPVATIILLATIAMTIEAEQLKKFEILSEEI